MTIAAVALLLAADPVELYRQGTGAFARGQREEAARLLTEAARLAPKNAQIWKALGVVYASAEAYEHAAEPFERACALDPKLVDACYYLGRNLFALNRFAPSLQVLRKALPDDRDPSRVHLAIAQALEALGEAAEAEKSFQAAVKQMRSPHADYDPRVHFALFLYRQGRVREALSPAEAAVQAHPNAARPHFEIGRIHYQLGNLPAAVQHLGRAAELGHEAAPPLLAKAKARLSAAAATPRN
jgi:tetratricopeptide (TPR) repeat protein